MPFDEDDDPFGLGPPPPARLRKAEPPPFKIIGPLTRSEVEALQENPGVAPGRVLQKLRHHHHRLAQLVAKGERLTDISLVTGYSPNYIDNLTRYDPSFKQLVTDYQQVVADRFVDAIDRLKVLGISSVEELQDRLENDPESFSKRELIEIVEMALVKPMARGPSLGGGGSSGQAPVNVQVNFVEASKQPEMKTIEIPALERN